jgi:hypothetical protein
MITVTPRAMRALEMLTLEMLTLEMLTLEMLTLEMLTLEAMTLEAMTAAVIKANKRTPIYFPSWTTFRRILPARGHYSISSRIPFAARSSSG